MPSMSALSRAPTDRSDNSVIVVIQGQGASAGRATGLIHRVRTLFDAQAAPRGSVVTVETLPPSWLSKLNGPAAVLVANGGALSSAATVLRERSIPAVVGIGDGIDTLRDGDLVSVDGTNGTVRVH